MGRRRSKVQASWPLRQPRRRVHAKDLGHVAERVGTTRPVVEIGGLTLGDGFQGLLPWGLIDNRPYLRCLHGRGLCLWRGGDLASAGDVFRRMLWLNPHDNQGARFNLAAVEAGHSWEAAGAEEDDVPGR
jgi:hypothetical protein